MLFENSKILKVPNKIPHSVFSNSLIVKTGIFKKYLIDLQIRYNDSSFTDTRSGISFVKWLKKKGQY